jgi:hypothetical protein
MRFVHRLMVSAPGWRPAARHHFQFIANFQSLRRYVPFVSTETLIEPAGRQWLTSSFRPRAHRACRNQFDTQLQRRELLRCEGHESQGMLPLQGVDCR